MKIVRLLTRWLLSVLLAAAVAWIFGFIAYWLVVLLIEPSVLFSSIPLLAAILFVFFVVYGWSMEKMKKWASQSTAKANSDGII